VQLLTGIKTVAPYSEKTAEIKTLKTDPWIKDRILVDPVFGPGFYENQLFAGVEENWGYFVSRIKKKMGPIVVSIEKGVPKTKCKEFRGKPTTECIKQLSINFLKRYRCNCKNNVQKKRA
jgi:putative transposase